MATIRIVNEAGTELLSPFNSDRVPPVGEIVVVGDESREVTSHSTNFRTGAGGNTIQVTTVITKAASAKSAKITRATAPGGRQELRG